MTPDRIEMLRDRIRAAEARGDANLDILRLSVEEANQLLDHADLEFTFNIRWEADMRAIKLWQQAHPGNDLTWPDHADLVVWLEERYQERQTELLASNNALLERARNAEMALQALTKLTEKAALASAG